MYTASQKKKENVAEYLLYMWQIEDLIRAHNLDMDKIKTNIIDKYTGLNERQLKDMVDWYESLIDMMRREDVVETGHLQINKNVISQLDELSARLIRDPKYADYGSQYYKTLPYIVEIRAKAGDNKSGEIESCFNALYGILLLRLQQKEISAETLDAATQISRLLAMLSKYYIKDQNNELFTQE
ncbi:MAG: DUF4924 family protein [Prevotella sp.]|nr:DUF4924 family protein [Bacteroides sp.]MCM1366121.1 DUF4924 family protein [Prevotella sp.]MCM1437530.1 DUF4924 family protein [Prevotella sp.]